MDNFTANFRDWMDSHRMKASEVADAVYVTEQAVRNWRSAGVPQRRQAQLADWMASVDAAKKGEPIDYLRVRPLVVEPTPAEFDAWQDAALAARKRLTEWARDGLNQMAHQRGYGEAPNPVGSAALRVAQPSDVGNDYGPRAETASPGTSSPSDSDEGAA